MSGQVAIVFIFLYIWTVAVGVTLSTHAAPDEMGGRTKGLQLREIMRPTQDNKCGKFLALASRKLTIELIPLTYFFTVDLLCLIVSGPIMGFLEKRNNVLTFKKTNPDMMIFDIPVDKIISH